MTGGMFTVDEARAMGDKVDPEFEPILGSGHPVLGGWTMDTDVVKIRAMIAQMRASKPASDPATLPYTQRDIEIPVRDGRTVPARVYTPREESGTATTGGGMAGSGRRGMVVFHGGGYAVGDAETEEWLCAAFARLGGVSVNVEYRLSPEWAFPAAAHDALDATRWVAAEAARGGLGVNPGRGLLVGGESGGADLALAVAAECARAGDLSPPLAGIYAAIPSCIDARTAGGRYAEYLVSKEQCARAPLLTRQSMEFIESIYKPDPDSPLAWPLATDRAAASLPPTYVQVCGLDPTRDAGLVLARALQDAGVSVRLDAYPGLPHGFWAVFPHLAAAQRHADDSRRGLEWLLQRGG